MLRNHVQRYRDRIGTAFSDRQFTAVKQALDQVLPFVLLLILFLVTFQFVVPVTEQVQQWITVLNWAVIGYFVVRLGVDYRLAEPDENFLKEHWMDIMMVLPMFSVVQEARAAKLAQESRLLPAVEDAMASEEAVAASTLRNTGVAAKLTKMVRILKRSI